MPLAEKEKSEAVLFRVVINSPVDFLSCCPRCHPNAYIRRLPIDVKTTRQKPLYHDAALSACSSPSASPFTTSQSQRSRQHLP